LVKAAAAQGWGLYQINRQQASLEDVFVQLTQQE
jgi:ABC-2 type transport system ATP-binding protein